METSQVLLRLAGMMTRMTGTWLEQMWPVKNRESMLRLTVYKTKWCHVSYKSDECSGKNLSSYDRLGHEAT